MNRIKILGSGLARGSQKVTNFDLEKRVETNDEWIVQRTGITSRYISETENTSDLAVRASLHAIECWSSKRRYPSHYCCNNDT